MKSAKRRQSRPIRLARLLGALKPGANRISRSPSGFSLWAVKRGDAITKWLVKDRSGKITPSTVSEAEGGSGTTIRCYMEICHDIVVQTDPPQNPPATAKECWTVEIKCP